MRNFYKVLGIASTADDRRIKSAFRRRAKAFHPDLNPGDRRAEDRFKELTQAYEVLRSARARASYDAYLADRRSETRRRFARSAALMAASFMLTIGSAFAVLSLHDAGAPFAEGWQPATSARRIADAATSAIVRQRASDGQGPHVASIASGNTPGVGLAKASPAAAVLRPDEATKPRQSGAMDGNAAVPRAKPASVRRHKPEKKLAAASRAPRPTPARAEHKQAALRPAVAIGEEGRQWPAADEPFMGLGATSR